MITVPYDAKTVNRARDLLEQLRLELPPHSTPTQLSVLAESEVSEDISSLLEHIETVSEAMADVMMATILARQCACDIARVLAQVDELERWWLVRLPKRRYEEAMDDMDRITSYVLKSGDAEGCSELLMNWFWLSAGHR